jgi:putative intracellular protease/amidase
MKVYLFLAEGFEEIEAIAPVDIFRRAGIETITVSISSDKIVTGAQKSILLGFNYEVAILLGTLSAVGGGILRDIILKQIPVVLRKEIYGLAALV